MPNHSSQTPNWQPLTQLPLIAQMIDGELAETETQYQNLQAAKSRPHILDDYTVGRLVEVFGKRQEFFEIYAEQLARWKAENLNATQKKEIDRLEGQLKKLRGANAEILALTDELKEGTIEKVLLKSDLEMGLDVLLGKTKF
ncbi:MAG: hypothetical protein DSM106950_10245 [Stigonema ocellatum SAG 48.90 = DSM 106950]|nr:hypothetical protein [Stigonema ocellatum SAG 48.90 = DSM 106950]